MCLGSSTSATDGLHRRSQEAAEGHHQRHRRRRHIQPAPPPDPAPGRGRRSRVSSAVAPCEDATAEATHITQTWKGAQCRAPPSAWPPRTAVNDAPIGDGTACR
ncbi:hypothetical protein CHLRE_12g526427v5 [Chlamydomonas reinhardtii]|uniref:Uncharacterized protein n=1 Tax=Chlamydomonas reinhardtii TaxID=3055 RepID=A0A2K3D4H9_CHLRE|nr:uncharacterized protein CHLRE_12g526427v5 [Chlamydomonas reinhardtii]PNW75438.1 hypothetical protein CHLRE_12g526427v5 [Chlamydomonas reinhardtii]